LRATTTTGAARRRQQNDENWGQKSFFLNDESIGFGPLTIGTALQPMAAY
jgi:hypothetical protein